MGLGSSVLAQPKAEGKPIREQSSSTFSFGVEDDAETITISNVAYEVTGSGIPGRPRDEQLVLRKTTRTKQVVDDIGMEASTMVEAWPLGVDFKQKPLYALTVEGIGSSTIESELLEIPRGVEEVEWWSYYKLGNGQHLFDSYVPLVKFSISRETVTERYAGLEVPPDDVPDTRLRESHVVGVLTYSSGEKVIREALITADDPKQAQLLRSFADAYRKVELVEREAVPAPGKKTAEPARSIRISISQYYPSAPATVTLTIPILGDDLDLTHAQTPARMRMNAWKR
jgi:hypothetical protein